MSYRNGRLKDSIERLIGPGVIADVVTSTKTYMSGGDIDNKSMRIDPASFAEK